MTSAAHLSKELQQLIKGIGQTKSKQQEDRIITNQVSTLKPKLIEKQITPKKMKELLIRALYIEMLGHSASFAHIHAVNLTQSKNLTLKRIGYLLCSLFLNKDSDLLIMLVSTIQKDLNSSDIHEIVICLTSLGSIMSTTIAEAITESVVKLLGHTTDLVRKKALLVLQKIQLVSGNQIPDYKQKMKKALCDREPSVMAGVLNLYLQEVKTNTKKYKDLMPSFVIILKQVIEHKLPKEFDYHRLPAPWIQMKLIKIIQILGKNDLKNSQHCYAILEQALKRAGDVSNNIAFAVTYQCVKTICTIYPNQNLLHQAASSLAKFLTSNNNNLKFMGLQVLGQLHNKYPNLLTEYQLTVIDCLESKDETLKKQTLQLLYRMTNQDNIEITVTKMLDALHSSTDSYFRNALVSRITELAQRFAPNHEWYLQTMQLLFELGSQYLNEQVLNNFLKLVMENYETNPDFGAEIVQKMQKILQKTALTDFIIKVSSWIIGEIGATHYSTDSQKLSQLSKIIIHLLDTDFQKTATKVWVLDALIKIASAKDFKQHLQVKLIIQKCIKEKDNQLYQRALESKKLAKYNAALRKSTQLVFEQGLPFLESYVQTALQNGARPYQKHRARQTFDPVLRFKAYQQKTVQSTFPFKTEQKKPQPNIPTIPQVIEQSQIKNKPIVIPPKPKRQIITPQQKAKNNLANALFGKGGKTGVKPTPPPQGSNSKKKVQDVDLLS